MAFFIRWEVWRLRIPCTVLLKSGFHRKKSFPELSQERTSIVVQSNQATKKRRQSIHNYLVIPYLPFTILEKKYFDSIIYPEGFEKYHFKAAIPARNKYLVDNARYALCYVTHGWGGAAKTFERAKKKGLIIVNIGDRNTQKISLYTRIIECKNYHFIVCAIQQKKRRRYSQRRKLRWNIDIVLEIFSRIYWTFPVFMV